MKNEHLALISTLWILAYTPISGAQVKDFGLFYPVPQAQSIAPDTEFKLAFDVAEQADVGNTNFAINSLARFINMHLDAGVHKQNIQLALVIHGNATKDLLANDFYQQEFKQANKNQLLIEQLLTNNVQVFVCGQSATHHKIKQDMLIPGVKISLSAMTAHSQLQQQGYGLNPF